jgi:hypothetical protein
MLLQNDLLDEVTLMIHAIVVGSGKRLFKEERDPHLPGDVSGRKQIMKEEKIMQSGTQTAAVSKKRLWAGRILSGLLSLFLLADSVAKLVKPAPVVEGTIKLGYSESVILPLGIVLLACTIIYMIPRTAVLGAILLTGYLGGAVATHVRVGDPLFSVLFPVIFGMLIWGGLYLRDDRLRALIPLRG